VSDAAKDEFGDPLSRPFWQAAERRQLVVQRCAACGRHQFYPRPFCLGCQSDRVEWVGAKGTGTVYSQSRLHISAGPGFEPPYVVAVVELDEGPRLVTNIVGGDCRIGDAVRVTWRERAGAPPLPVFEPVSGGG
jgi:uncharacterized OB-fold protein